MLSEAELYVQEIQRLRQRCLDDLFFFGSMVLGYDFLEDPADFHREAVAALYAQRDLLFLAPRNHIKTTLVDVVGTIHHLLRYPDDRVLIASATWELAKATLKEIVGHYRNGGKDGLFHKLFPEFKPQSKEEEGNTEMFSVPCRTRVRKEASIETTGQDRVITGRHYDVIRCTDMVVRENVPPAAQPEQMMRTIEWFRTTGSLLDTTNPRAHRTVDGTRWHTQDLYGEILRNPSYARFQKQVVGITEDAQGDPVPIWNKMPADVLKQRRDEAGSYLWAANYKNSPNPLESAGFRREWFKDYNAIPDVVDIAITVDLAISDKETADRTAILVTGVTPSRDLYVLAMRVGRFSPFDTVEHLYTLDAEWNPSWIGIESVAWQKAMWFILNDQSQVRGKQLPIRKLMPDGSKIRRASVLQVLAEARGIYVRPEHGELIEECISFPSGAHDDIVDALAYRAQDMYSPEVLRALAPPIWTVPSTSGITGDQLLAELEGRQTPALPWEIELNDE